MFQVSNDSRGRNRRSDFWRDFAVSVTTEQEYTFIAHVLPCDDGTFRLHSLEDHLKGVAALAEAFGSKFGSGDWAYVAGLWHDLGKYSKEFQSYIRRASGFDSGAHLEGQPGRVDHSTAGAIYSVTPEQLGRSGRVLAYLIAGHHAGLPDWLSEDAGRSSLESRLEKRSLLDAVFASSPPQSILEPPKPTSKPTGRDPALWMRMLFSSLVDADFLDTEFFMDPQRAQLRENRGFAVSELKSVFDEYMEVKQAAARNTVINGVRAKIFERCKQAASGTPGVYSLTVPTGGGKTLSSLAFALEHAVTHGKERIIYVIPYTSIIEQTAQIFRSIFGDQIIEHHSNIDPSVETPKSRLACENWDGPLIVTTSVQFFESLFAARTSRVRKLHNIVNSVVILDEAQLLPPDFLLPVIDVIRELCANYSVTCLLSTATQPALSPKTTLDFDFPGIPDIQEIMEDSDGLYESLKRVEIVVPNNFNSGRSWESIARELETHEKVLCIVNRRADCRELCKLMPEGTIHLSGLMCGEHRSEVIDTIKFLLGQSETLRVISTQLVEAGVDIDFPVVFRALAGIDSIAQAAGRCNREGLLSIGKLVVFVPPHPAPRGHLRQAESCGKQILMNNENDPLSPKSFTAFFEQLFWKKGESLDKHGIRQLLRLNEGLEISFRSAAARFKIIDEGQQLPVIVRFSHSPELISELIARGPTRALMRRLQRFIVNIPKPIHSKLVASGDLVEIHKGIFAQAHEGLYDRHLGLRIDEPQYHDAESLII